MIIKSKRLYLRRFKIEDLDSFYLMESDPDVMKFTGPGRAQSKSESEARLEKIVNYKSVNKYFGYWGVIEVKSRELIGFVMLTPSKNDPTEIELGFMLRKSVWGDGYTFEAITNLLSRAEVFLKGKSLVAVANKDNIQSIKILKKIGFVATETNKNLIYYVRL